jgi:CubicO group peptidase (beta-lactamase class C family)
MKMDELCWRSAGCRLSQERPVHPEAGMHSVIRVTTLIFFLLAGCSAPPVKPETIRPGDYESVKQYLTRMIQTQMKEFDVKGLSIALVDDQRVIWAEGFGFADAARQIPATPETAYRVASISKLFTVTAAMQLAEQGKLDIDRPIQTYLPEFSMKTRFQNAGPITPRMMMTHHSGLPADRLKGRLTRNPAPFGRLVTEIKDEYVAYPPNYIYNYSSLAMGLLGHIVERVSGRDFVTYMDDAIFRPLEMVHSSFVYRPEIEPNLAEGYMNDHPVGVEDLTIRNLPASGLYSNVLDLSRFMQMMFAEGQSGGRRILKPETVAEMLRPQNTDVLLDFDFRVGLGWFLWDIGIPEAGPAAGHGGDLMVFYSDMQILPKQKLGVVVLANTATSDHVVFPVAETAMKLALKAKTGLTQSKPVELLPTYPVRLSDKILRSYQGQYATVAGPHSIKVEGRFLWVKTPEQTLHLVPRADGWFIPRYKILGLFPRNISDNVLVAFAAVSGREVVVMRHGKQNRLFGERIRPSPIPESWLNRVGPYEVINQDDHLKITTVRLKNKSGVLMIEAVGELPTVPGAGRKVVMPIAPISDTEAVIHGPGFGMGETVYVVNHDGEERILYSGYEARKILKP